jgi:hypothetical protein
MYYLHDKEAQTTERVDWVEARNMPVNDNNAAIKMMAYTAMSAEKLKQEAGVPFTGRKKEKGVVYTFSLSWSPDEKPDRVLMVKSADETIELLGLKEHQSLIIAHNDTKHPHVHVICNLVNPNDGRMHDPDWGSKLKMSEWALKHEFENGKVYCQQRADNIEKRRSGEAVKYREPLHDRKAEIQELYRQSDSGAAFANALKEQGYTLATGNRRRFVLVDDEGKIHSLSRQLDKNQRKDHLQKLSDIAHQNLPLAQEVAQEQQYFDRDKQEREQLQRMEDAAIEKAKQEEEAEKQARAKAQEQKTDAGEKEKRQEKPLQSEWNIRAGNEKGKPKSPEKDPAQLAREQSQKWDEKILQDRENQRRVLALQDKLKGVYNRDEQVRKIANLERQIGANDNLFGKFSGRLKKLEEELEAQKMNLASIDQRIAEQMGALKNDTPQEKPTIEPDGNAPQPEPPTPVVDLEAERKKRKEAYKEKLRQQIKGKSEDQDKDRTLDR